MPRKAGARMKPMHVSFPAQQREWLAKLSEWSGVSQAELVRRFVYDGCVRMGVEKYPERVKFEPVEFGVYPWNVRRENAAMPVADAQLREWMREQSPRGKEALARKLGLSAADVQRLVDEAASRGPGEYTAKAGRSVVGIDVSGDRAVAVEVERGKDGKRRVKRVVDRPRDERGKR